MDSISFLVLTIINFLHQITLKMISLIVQIMEKLIGYTTETNNKPLLLIKKVSKKRLAKSLVKIWTMNPY